MRNNKSVFNIKNDIYGIELDHFNTAKDFSLAIINFLEDFAEDKVNILGQEYPCLIVSLYTPPRTLMVLYKLDSGDMEIFKDMYKQFKYPEYDHLYFSLLNLRVKPSYGSIMSLEMEIARAWISNKLLERE